MSTSTTRRPWVYVSSPYTKGDVAINVRAQMDTADLLLTLGMVPVVPLYSHFQHMFHPRPYEEWIALDLEIVSRCDVCLRIAAEYDDGNGMTYRQWDSSGADREVQEFERLGKPVLFTIEDVQQWAAVWRTGFRGVPQTPQPAPVPPAAVTPPREHEPDSRAGILHIDTDDTIDERGWHERGNEDGAMADAVSGSAGDPGTPVENRASPGGGAAERSGGRGAAVNADGLRTERVTLEVTHACDYAMAQWILSVVCDGLTPHESVRVVEEAAEITRLTDERDAAIRERDEAMGRVTHLERANEALQDACNVATDEWEASRKECERLRAAQLTSTLTGDRYAEAIREAESLREQLGSIACRAATAETRVEELEAAAANAGGEANCQGSLDGSQPVAWGFQAEDGSLAHVSTTQPFPSTSIVVPLYAAPQPPRGWLTKEDCEALYLARAVLDGVFVGSWQEKHDAARRLVAIRERAIRDAGGEVAE